MSVKTAFVLSGGGSLGAVQAGMLRGLLAVGVQPDFILGVSVGALNACYFAGTPTAEGVMGLQRVWSGLRRRDVFPIGLASALRMLWHPGHLVNPG